MLLKRNLKTPPSNLNYDWSLSLFLHGTISKEIGNKNMSDPYVPSRYLCVFWGERRLGVKVEARAGYHKKVRRYARLNLTPNLLSP